MWSHDAVVVYLLVSDEVGATQVYKTKGARLFASRDVYGTIRTHTNHTARYMRVRAKTRLFPLCNRV